jgi:hypothetical protein
METIIMTAMTIAARTATGFSPPRTLNGRPSPRSGLRRLARLIRATLILADEARRRAPMSPPAMRDLGVEPQRRRTV